MTQAQFNKLLKVYVKTYKTSVEADEALDTASDELRCDGSCDFEGNYLIADQFIRVDYDGDVEIKEVTIIK